MKKKPETVEKRLIRLISTGGSNVTRYGVALKLYRTGAIPQDAFLDISQLRVGFDCPRLSRAVAIISKGRRLRCMTIAGGSLIDLKHKDGLAQLRKFFTPAAAAASKRAYKARKRSEKIQSKRSNKEYEQSKALGKTVRGEKLQADADAFNRDWSIAELREELKSLVDSLVPTLSEPVVQSLRKIERGLKSHNIHYVNKPFGSEPTPTDFVGRRKEILATAKQIGFPVSRLYLQHS